MEIKNRELKIEMLDTFASATLETLSDFAEFAHMLPPFLREIKADVVVDLLLSLRNNQEITEIDRKIKVLEAFYELNSTILAENIPKNYGIKGAENQMKLVTGLNLLRELIGELKDEANR